MKGIMRAKCVQLRAAVMAAVISAAKIDGHLDGVLYIINCMKASKWDDDCLALVLREMLGLMYSGVLCS